MIEAGWSIELDESSIDSEPLPEMPQATAVYEETGRHWFWASYSLVQEEGAWRIQSMTDEGINALNLSIEELQKIKDQHIDRIGEITRKHKPTDKNAPQYALEMLQHLMQAASYMDVLVKKLPGNPSVYEEAVAHLFMLGQFERGLVYLEPLTVPAIEAVIAADDAGGMRPHMSLTRGVAIQVRLEDAARAREILNTPATSLMPNDRNEPG